MTKILNMSDHSPDGWLSGETVCLACGAEGVAVAPVQCIDHMECSACGCFKKVLKYPVQRGDVDWVCGCGNELFRINPNGAYCPMCRKYQDVQ